jgi:hypothetical protein
VQAEVVLHVRKLVIGGLVDAEPDEPAVLAAQRRRGLDRERGLLHALTLAILGAVDDHGRLAPSVTGSA